MPEIQAFRALRYDPGHVGSLSDVTAPPYDVIDPELQQALYERHPANVVRLILNRDEPGDDEQSNRYVRAARLLAEWRRQGVLRQDPDPAVYVYHQQFVYGGRQYTRRGFMARVRLVPFGQGTIYPHEETHAGPKQDRLRLMRACRANLSQVFALYPDPQNEAQQLLEEAIVGQTPWEAVDHLGVVHRMWMVTDVERIAALAASIGPKPLFIADGHHRYETARAYRDELAAERPLPADHPANYVLTMCVGMSDPGMLVLPTHRLLRGFPPLDSQRLARLLEGPFAVAPGPADPAGAADAWRAVQRGEAQGELALYAPADRRWLLARIAPAGVRRMAELAPGHSEAWRSLGVSILQRLIIEDLLGVRDAPPPHYAHLIDEVVEALGGAEPYALAALVAPASLEDVRRLSERGERMPPKSTYFYPKLLSGLVINPLE